MFFVRYLKYVHVSVLLYILKNNLIKMLLKLVCIEKIAGTIEKDACVQMFDSNHMF